MQFLHCFNAEARDHILDLFFVLADPCISIPLPDFSLKG